MQPSLRIPLDLRYIWSQRGSKLYIFRTLPVDFVVSIYQTPTVSDPFWFDTDPTAKLSKRIPNGIGISLGEKYQMFEWISLHVRLIIFFTGQEI